MPSDSGKSGMKIDFHIHSVFSTDGDIAVKEIITLAKKAGLDGIAVTDHNTIRGGMEAEKLAGNGLVVFVGSEIATTSGEIIGLNLKEDVPKKLSPLETCKLIKDQGGFVIVPHPFDKLRKGIGKELENIIEYVDAIEVFNARTMAGRFNRKAEEFASKHGIPGVAGSDSHFSDEIGSAYTLVDSGENKDEILEAVRQGKTKILGWKTGMKPHWKTFVKNVGNKF